MPYLAYVRVSTQKQNLMQDGEHEGLSLSAQKRIIREYAERQGLEIGAWHEDVESGTSNVRPGFKAAMKDLAKADGIIFHKIDRSARNMHDFAVLNSWSNKKDIRFVEGEFKTDSATGRLAFRIMCDFAIFYSENLSGEVKKGMTEAVRRQRFPHQAPFGYETGERSGIPKPSSKAPIVKKIFELYDEGGYSIRDIVKFLNERGFQLATSYVASMLKHPFYIGKFKWKGQVYQGSHEPIISSELFERVQSRILGHGKTKTHKFKFVFSGRVLCPDGTIFSGYEKTKKGKTYMYWRNQTNGVNFPESLIHEALAHFVCDNEKLLKKFTPKLIEEARTNTDCRGDIKKAEGEQIEKEIGKLETESARVMRGYDKGVYELEEATEKREKILSQIESLRNDFARKEHAIESLYFSKTAEFFEPLKTLQKKDFKQNDEVNALILDLFVSNLVYENGNLIVKPSSALQKAQQGANSMNGAPLPLILELAREIKRLNLVPKIDRLNALLATPSCLSAAR